MKIIVNKLYFKKDYYMTLKITVLVVLLFFIFTLSNEKIFARTGGNLGTIIVRDNINKEGKSQPCAYVYRENEKSLYLLQ
jgi:hypothetical protein